MFVFGAWWPRSTRHLAFGPSAVAQAKLVPQSAIVVA